MDEEHCIILRNTEESPDSRSTRRGNGMTTDELRKAAECVFLATDEVVARDIAEKLTWAAYMIDALQEFSDEMQDLAIWMTGCGYDFGQHEFFIKRRGFLISRPVPEEEDAGC